MEAKTMLIGVWKIDLLLGVQTHNSSSIASYVVNNFFASNFEVAPPMRSKKTQKIKQNKQKTDVTQL